MGNVPGGGGGPPGGAGGGKGKDGKDGQPKKKRFESKGGPTRVGRKKRKKGPAPIARLPKIFPNAKCKLRLSKLTRVKDFLLLEEEFMRNQEILKPKKDKDKAELEAVEEIRGTPLAVGTLEEMIDDNHCIISTSNGPEYYVNITSFVEKDQLEPGCSVLLHNKVRHAPFCTAGLRYRPLSPPFLSFPFLSFPFRFASALLTYSICSDADSASFFYAHPYAALFRQALL